MVLTVLFHLTLKGSTYSVSVVRPDDGFVELSSGLQTVTDGGKFLNDIPSFAPLMSLMYKDRPTV